MNTLRWLLRQVRSARERFEYLSPSHPVRAIVLLTLTVARWGLWIGLVAFVLWFGWDTWQDLEARDALVAVVTDASPADCRRATAVLDEVASIYEVSADSSTILVSPGEAHRVRLRLAEAGLPEAGRVTYPDGDQIDFAIAETLLGHPAIDHVDVRYDEDEAKADVAWGSFDASTVVGVEPVVLHLVCRARPTVANVTVQQIPTPLPQQDPPTGFDSVHWIEHRRAAKAQELLDEMLGTNRSYVRVRVEPAQLRAGPVRISSDAMIGRLHVDLLLSRTQLIFDDDRRLVEAERDPDDVDAILQVLPEAIGLREGRGDSLSARVAHFDQDRLAQARSETRAPTRPPSASTDPLVAALVAQALVESDLERKSRSFIDEIIGSGRAYTGIAAIVDLPIADARLVLTDRGAWSYNFGSDEVVNAEPVVGRLSLTMVIDRRKVIIDPDTREIHEIQRPQQEADNLVDVARTAVGYDEARGDRFAMYMTDFDVSQEVMIREAQVEVERREFWIGIAINVAKVLGILAALITLRFIIQAIGRGVGVEDLDSEGDSSSVRPQPQYEEQLAEVTEQMDTARDMQMGLMPSNNPQIPGFSIAGFCKPADHVGGDFFQYLRLSEDRWLACVADVTGHGMGAAIPVVMFAGLLQSHVHRDHALETLLERINTAMHGTMTEGTLTRRTFVCFSGLEIQVGERRVRVTNSGCPYPFHYRASTGVVSEIEIDAYPLGIRPNSRYQLVDVVVEPGDCIVLCTDGVIEAADRFGNMFGFERMTYLIRECCRQGDSAERVRARVFEEVEAFCDGLPQADDETLVVIQVAPSI